MQSMVCSGNRFRTSCLLRTFKMSNNIGKNSIRTGARSVSIVFATVLVFAVLATLTRPENSMAAFWPANAVLLGMMVRYRRFANLWGWIAAGLGFGVAELAATYPFNISLLFTAANMAGALTGWLLFRLLRFSDRRLMRPLAVLYLFIICLAASIAAACVGGGALDIYLGYGIIPSFLRWMVAELANQLIILPVLLTIPSFLTLRSLVGQLTARSTWTIEHAAPSLTLVISLVLGKLVDGPGIVGFLVPALLWCAVSYSVFTTAILTMLSCSWLLLSIAGVISAFPVLSQMYEFQPSLRFGIALMSIGPLLVATINTVRNKELSELSRAAYFDVLTGLLSRSAFRERGQKLLRESIVAGRDLTAIMLDIDHFKQINDQNGHASGDKVLIDFAQLVRDRLRECDLFGRLGGEEFAILLPNTSSKQAEKIASRVRLSVQNATFTGTDNQHLKVTVSMGLVDISDCQTMKLDELLHCADQSMYAAKSSGRNIVIRHKSNAE